MTELIPTRNEAYQTRHLANVPSLSFKNNFFKNTFSPSTILEWNKLDPSLWNSASYNVFKNSILKFIRPSPNKIFQCHNPKGIKLVTRLRLGLSHLREHKFKHSFQDTLNPLCSCGLYIETTSFKDEVNFLILHVTMDFVLSTNRFDEPLYLPWIDRCFSFYS